MFWKILQYWQENTYVRVSSLNLWKRDSSTCVLLLQNFWRTSAYSCFWTNSSKYCLELFLECPIQNHPNSVILQKYQLLSNKSFKKYSPYVVYLTPTCLFEPRFHIFIIKGCYNLSLIVFWTGHQTLIFS